MCKSKYLGKSGTKCTDSGGGGNNDKNHWRRYERGKRVGEEGTFSFGVIAVTLRPHRKKKNNCYTYTVEKKRFKNGVFQLSQSHMKLTLHSTCGPREFQHLSTWRYQYWLGSVMMTDFSTNVGTVTEEEEEEEEKREEEEKKEEEE